MKIIFSTLIIFFLFGNLLSQYICGSDVTKEVYSYVTDTNGVYNSDFIKLDNYNPNILKSFTKRKELDFVFSFELDSECLSFNASKKIQQRKIALKVVISRDDDGHGGISESQFEKLLKTVNEDFKNLNMFFFVDEYVDLNDSEVYETFYSIRNDYFGFNGITEKYNDHDKINIYVVNKGDGSLSKFPSDHLSHIILLKDQNIEEPTVFSHELGHWFGLWHTFQTHSGLGELVNGDNCKSEGDLICDTPADSYGLSYDRETCVCTSQSKDSNGDKYMPMMNNIMSYYSGCADLFTAEQEKVILFNLIYNRSAVIKEENIKEEKEPPLVDTDDDIPIVIKIKKSDDVNDDFSDQVYNYLINKLGTNRKNILLENKYGLQVRLGNDQVTAVNRIKLLKEYGMLNELYFADLE